MIPKKCTVQVRMIKLLSSPLIISSFSFDCSYLYNTFLFPFFYGQKDSAEIFFSVYIFLQRTIIGLGVLCTFRTAPPVVKRYS